MQSAVNVTASGLELRQNSGKNQIVDLAKSRLKNAMRTAANNMSVDLYSTRALTNQMGGLGAIITSDGTGTVGGIVSGTYTFWKNQFREITGSNAWTKSTIRDEMQALWISQVRGTDKPDLIVSTNDMYSAYWGGLSDNQRYTNDEKNEATVGFQSLKFNTADVMHDNNSNFTSTGEKMYFLNTEYLKLVVHRDANWSQLDDRNSVNQDAVVIPIIWQGQLTCSNRSLQGVLLDAG